MKLQETQTRLAADQLLKEVAEKVTVAEDELQRMADAEIPFLKVVRSHCLFSAVQTCQTADVPNGR